MKRQLPLFLLTIGCFLIHCVLFGQDSIGKTYSIKFSRYQTHLPKEANTILNDVARSLKDQPGYNLVVIGYCGASENERFNQIRWERINKIIDHFVKKLGLNADRFIFNYGSEGGDCDTVDLRFTDEKLPTDPPPHPNLRNKN